MIFCKGKLICSVRYELCLHLHALIVLFCFVIVAPLNIHHCTLYRPLESIRASGPPKESDWWITKDANNDSSEDRTKKSSSIFSTISSLSANKTVTEPAKEFCNCGLLTWEESRQKWRTQTVAERPSPPPPVNSADVVAGLTQVQRTYELPGRMTLTSAVELLVEIWECDKDY